MQSRFVMWSSLALAICLIPLGCSVSDDGGDSNGGADSGGIDSGGGSDTGGGYDTGGGGDTGGSTDTGGSSDTGGGGYTAPAATIVSRTSDGTPAIADQVDWHPRNLDLSGDGRFVLFRSRAPELVADPGTDIGCFLHDAQTGQTHHVTAPLTNVQNCRLSRNGEAVIFQSLFEDPNVVYRYDVATGQTTTVFSAYAIGDVLAISANAHWAVFRVKEGPTDSGQYWLWDLGGAQPPAVVPGTKVVGVSDNGEVLMEASPWDLYGEDFYRPNLYVFDPADESMTLITQTANGQPSDIAQSFSYARISPDGTRVSFTSSDAFVDGIDGARIFIYERASGQWQAVLPEIDGQPVGELSPGSTYGPSVGQRYHFFQAGLTDYLHWRWDTQTGAAMPFIIGAESNVPHAQLINVSDDGRVAVFLSSDRIANVAEAPPSGVYAYRVELAE